jgi:hypothetical protein
MKFFQMKQTKVIEKMQNMMNQEFQHCVEFQLIEAMKNQRSLIQFESIVNLIQMKSTFMTYEIQNITY